MTQADVLLSVVIPTYNRARLIRRQLDRLARTDEGIVFEVLVVDDGSSDDTGNVVKGYAASNVRYLEQDHGGVSRARNRGIAEARGRYITFFDSDDEVRLGWRSGIEAGICCGQYGLVFCGAQVQSERGESARTHMPHDLGPLFQDVVGTFLAGTYVVRVDVLALAGGFDERLKFGENYELGIRLCLAVKQMHLPTLALPEVLVDMYEHPGPRGSRNLRNRFYGNVLTLRKHAALMEVHKAAAANLWGVAGVSALRMERYWWARLALGNAIRCAPGCWKNYVRWALTLAPLRRFNRYAGR